MACWYELDTHSVKVWWRYMLSNKKFVNFYDIFSDIGQCFQPGKENSVGTWKFDHIGINLNNTSYVWYFFQASTEAGVSRNRQIGSFRSTLLYTVFSMNYALKWHFRTKKLSLKLRKDLSYTFKTLCHLIQSETLCRI